MFETGLEVFMASLAPTLLFVGAGVLLMALAVPLIRRRVPPNPLYGLRVPATCSNPDVWYEANAVTGRHLFLLGAAMVLAAVVLPWLVGDWAPVVLAGVLVVGSLVLCGLGSRYAKRLLAARQDGS